MNMKLFQVVLGLRHYWARTCRLVVEQLHSSVGLENTESISGGTEAPTELADFDSLVAALRQIPYEFKFLRSEVHDLIYLVNDLRHSDVENEVLRLEYGCHGSQGTIQSSRGAEQEAPKFSNLENEEVPEGINKFESKSAQECYLRRGKAVVIDSLSEQHQEGDCVLEEQEQEAPKSGKLEIEEEKRNNESETDLEDFLIDPRSSEETDTEESNNKAKTGNQLTDGHQWAYPTVSRRLSQYFVQIFMNLRAAATASVRLSSKNHYKYSFNLVACPDLELKKPLLA
ncbi:hypothetical protein LguiA_001924 [Lonicera macranthoides]